MGVCMCVYCVVLVAIPNVIELHFYVLDSG